jgi:hypothetical protein
VASIRLNAFWWFPRVALKYRVASWQISGPRNKVSQSLSVAEGIADNWSCDPWATKIYLHRLASTCILNLATLAADSSEAFATATSLGRKLQCHNAANRCSEMQWRGVVDVEAFRKLVHARTTRMGGKQWHQESQRGYGMRIGYRRRCCLNAYLTSKACRHGFIANFPNAAENHPSPSESERRPSQWLFHGMCREDLWRTQCNVSRGIGYSMKR